MNLVVGLNRRCELKRSRPATPRARPAATKIPIAVGLAFLLISGTCSGGFRRCIFGRRVAARQELAHGRVSGLLQQFARDRSVYSARRKPTISARVIELQSAPPWKRTPNERSRVWRASSLDCQNGSPS